MTKSAMSRPSQFIISSEPRNPESLSRANDGLDQARVAVLDASDPRADGPGDHPLRRVRSEQGFEQRCIGPRRAKPATPHIEGVKPIPSVLWLLLHPSQSLASKDRQQAVRVCGFSNQSTEVMDNSVEKLTAGCGTTNDYLDF